MAKFKPYFEVDLPRDYSPKERESIAQEIIDELIARTESGLDANGKSFKGYSKAYIKEKGQANVDLTFSGDMLAEIQLLQNKSGKIRIGYDSSYSGIGKVEGNILGTYGTDKPIKPRNFLGITQKELNAILNNYPVNDKISRADRVATTSAAESAATSIAMGSGVEDG